MAIKGLSKFIVAPGYQYDQANNEISYGEDAAATEKLASYSVTPNTADDNNLYLDNAVAETSNGNFTDADISVGTGELTPETSKKLYRIKTAKIQSGDSEVDALVYDDSTRSNVVGVGLIEEHQLENENFYRGVIMPKVKFNVGEASAETRGESISWQTPKISGKVMKSDQYAESETDEDHPWKIIFDVDTESEALATIIGWFNAKKRTSE